MAKAQKYLYYCTLGLLVYMPFHIFFSQWLSTYTGGLDFWKIAKDLVLFLLIIFAVILVWLKNRFKDQSFWIFVGISIAYLFLHFFAWLINDGLESKPALLATVYNGRLFGFALLGWAAGILYGNNIQVKGLAKLLVILSTVVAAIGILQYFLPKDLLTHFGYSIERGVKPAFFIDDKPDLPRIMSTLRDPNSLGAYLILPITLLWAAWLRIPRARQMLAGALMINILALLLTSSRSAWLGVALSLGVFTFWSYKTPAIKFVKKYYIIIGIAVLFLLGGAYALRDQYIIQNYIFHADENTQLADSNSLHLDFAQQGLVAIAERPLGHGPGTAGLVSIQTDKVVLTENYFIQIGHEIGLQGLVVFVAGILFLVRLIYLRRDVYSRIMLSSLIGITLCSILLHTWSNEAVACQWFLVAGLLVSIKGKKGPKLTKRVSRRR